MANSKQSQESKEKLRKSPPSPPPSPTITKEKAKPEVEKKEATPKKPSLKEYSRQVEKVKLDPNIEAAEKMDSLKGSEAVSKQKEGLTALNIALMHVLVKMTKAGVDISEIKYPRQLKSKVPADLELTVPERTAIATLDRLVNESGSTSKYLERQWPETQTAAMEASKGLLAKSWGYAKKHPGGTLVLAAAGALGLYATYNLVRWALGEDPEEKGGKSSHFGKKALAAAGLSVLSMFLGKEYILKMLASVGLDTDEIKNELRARGGELSDETKKKVDKAGPEAKKAVEEMQKEYKRKVEEGAAEEPEEAVSADTEGKEKAKEAAEEIVDLGKYEGPRRLLIQAYCFDRYEYPDKDIDQVKRVMDDLQSQKIKISEIISLWHSHKGKGPKGKIPHKTKLVEFEDFLEEKNIYLAVYIIAHSAEEYKKRNPEIDYEKVSLREFFEEHIHSDAVRRVSAVVQDSLSQAIAHGNITSLAKINDLNLDNIESVIEQMGTGFAMQLAKDFEISLKDVNEAHFTSLVHSLYRNATLQMDAEVAMKNIDVSKYDPKAVEAAKHLYEATRKRTQKEIIPAAIARFNLDSSKTRDPSNADIIKNNLNDQISFRKAIQLNLVTRSIDFDKDPKSASSPAQELAFLFTVLSSIPKEQKARYISELTVLLAKAPSDIGLPSIELIQPYFKQMAEFGFKRLEAELKGLGYWISALVPNRTEAKQREFMRSMRDKDWVEFGSELGLEAGGGAIQVAKDFIVPFIESGRVTASQIGDCENAWDFVLLIKEAGGTFIYSKDAEGRSQGMIAFMGNYFVFRPVGVMKETFDAALEGDIGGAFKVYSVGTAPFVTLGAVHGWFSAGWGEKGWLSWTRAKGALKGMGRGYMYPYQALKAAGKAGYRTVEAVVNVHQAAAEYGSRPMQAARHAGRQAADVLKYRTLSPNLANLIENGRKFREYKAASKLTKLDWRDMLYYLRNERSTLLKRLAGGFNERMAMRYAEAVAKQYNNFFDFKPDSPARLELEGKSFSITDIDSAFKRMERFMDSAKSSSGVLDDMLKISKKVEGRELEKQILKQLQRLDGLWPDEYEALARQMRHKSGVEKFVKRLKDGIEASSEAKPARASVAAKLAERLRRPTGSEKLRSFGKTNEALRAAQKDLRSVETQIGKAKREIQILQNKRAQQMVPVDAEARLAEARRIIQDGEAAKLRLQKTVAALEKVGKAEKSLAGVADATSTEGSKLLVELQAAEEAAEDAWRLSKGTAKGLGKLGRLGTALKWGGRGLAGAGAALSAYAAISSGYEALTTDVEGRGTIKGIEAGMWAVNAAVDTAAVAVLFGAGGTAATAASYAALPLLPITYAGSTVLETYYEGTKTDYEWIQQDPYRVLHDFYTSVNSISLGDAWITQGREAAIEASMEGKKDTMRKIYRGLVAIQKDPTLLAYIMTEAPSKAKDKEVERRIEANFSKYHEFYFREKVVTGIQSYSSAQKFILEAQMFDSIMQQRDRLKAEGKEFVIQTKDKRFSLHLDRYDVIGGIDNPHARTIYMPDQVVAAYKEMELSRLSEDPVLSANLERMDTHYLVRLLVQMNKALTDEARKSEIDAVEGLRSDMVINADQLAAYLMMKRGIDLRMAASRPEYFQPAWTAKQIAQHLGSMGSLSNESYLAFEKDNYSITPGLLAVHRLAEYFGYHGEPIESKLKEFFNEASAPFRGLYWNGENWMIQEAGAEFDDKLGPVLTTAAVQYAIKRMREQPDNILEHRQDTIFVSAYDYEMEVKKMAQILEDGMTEGYGRGFKRSKEELLAAKVAAPEKFNPKKIDYSKERDPLMSDYRKAIEHIKTATGWSKLTYEVPDEYTIDLKRSDSDAHVRLYREENDKWNVGGFYGNLSLMQAISLGNLKNYTDALLSKNNETGGSNEPFYIDDGNIMFDRSWNAWNNLDLISAGNWLDFYDEAGVTKTDIINTLNNWYSKGAVSGIAAEAKRQQRIQRSSKKKGKDVS